MQRISRILPVRLCVPIIRPHLISLGFPQGSILWVRTALTAPSGVVGALWIANDARQVCIGAIAATDFFTIEGITWRGLVRYFVLFVIDLKTRQVEIVPFAHLGVRTAAPATYPDEPEARRALYVALTRAIHSVTIGAVGRLSAIFAALESENWCARSQSSGRIPP